MMDVSEFGAIGDGTADDHAAIEAALLAAVAVQREPSRDGDGGSGAIDADREA
jgi:hypothetical protein